MKKVLLLCMLLASSFANAGQMEDATLQMRYRMGASLLQEMELAQDLQNLKDWLERASREEQKLKNNLETLARLQQEISRELPASVAQERKIQEELNHLQSSYQGQLRAIYLHAPDAGEWVFASAEKFSQALEAEQSLNTLLQARLTRLRELRGRAAELELKLAGLQTRQKQMLSLAGQMQLSQADLAALGRRREQTLENIRRQQEELKQTQARLLEAQMRLARTASVSLPGLGASQAPSTGALAGKGSFFAPAQGKLLTPGREHFSLLATEPGALVRAPWAGVVAFAEPVAGYGRLIVIDHGDRLYSVLAHLSSLQAKTGQMLAAGQVVGVLDNSGLLYMEIRLAAKAQPVEKWLFLGGE